MNERAQVEYVFGVDDLMPEPWIATDETGREWTFHFWCEFPPSYAEREFDATAFSFRTVMRDCMFGMPPDRLGDWRKVATFSDSGERECFARGEIAETECELCEAKAGEAHGYVYIGDGWHEVVYRLQEPTVLETASSWHGGQASSLYSLASTGTVHFPSDHYRREVLDCFADTYGPNSPDYPETERAALRRLWRFIVRNAPSESEDSE